jgi:hypothetical protein
MRKFSEITAGRMHKRLIRPQLHKFPIDFFARLKKCRAVAQKVISDPLHECLIYQDSFLFLTSYRVNIDRNCNFHQWSSYLGRSRLLDAPMERLQAVQRFELNTRVFHGQTMLVD